jgi:hypothetical protein
MNKIKISVNRVEPSTKEVLQRQNFDEVIRKYNFSKSMLRSPWFYGAIGFSGILGFILLSNF